MVRIVLLSLIGCCFGLAIGNFGFWLNEKIKVHHINKMKKARYQKLKQDIQKISLSKFMQALTINNHYHLEFEQHQQIITITISNTYLQMNSASQILNLIHQFQTVVLQKAKQENLKIKMIKVLDQKHQCFFSIKLPN